MQVSKTDLLSIPTVLTHKFMHASNCVSLLLPSGADIEIWLVFAEMLLAM